MFEVEAIDNSNMNTFAVNLKEYHERYKGKNISKKHKGMRKNALGMNFKSYAGRIMSLIEHEITSKKKWHHENDQY